MQRGSTSLHRHLSRSSLWGPKWPYGIEDFFHSNLYFLSSGQIIPKRPLTPPISNQRVGIVTQHTIHRPHSPHSAQHLLILLSTSFQRFISNEQFFACFKVGPCRNGIRHQKTFRRGGDPPKKNGKTTFSMHTGAAPGSEKM